MSVIHTPKKPPLDFRVLAFPAVMVALLGVLFLRLWYIQVVEASDLAEKAKATQKTSIKTLAPRGLIYDRGGRIVAGVHPEIVITAIPAVVNKNDSVLEKVANLLHTDIKKLRSKLREAAFRPQIPAAIFVGADIETGTKIAEESETLPGIGVETQPMRDYPDSTSFTHVLGYVWTPNDKDVARFQTAGRDTPPYVGKAGIERAYDLDLIGTPGLEQVEVDARRKPLKVASRDAAMPGDQLVLTLDARLQAYATELLQEKKYLGGVVALDPRSGEVLCLVSSPTFDLNMFDRGISDTEWRSLSGDENNPMWNRAIFSAYAPGSTFKVVTSIAAEESGHFNPNQTYLCEGGVKLGKTFFKCLGHHGEISYHDALVKSCNSYFYQLGRDAGPEAIYRAATELGLGSATGLEIGGESKGSMPSPDRIAKFRKDGKWYTGDTFNTAIGQGFVSTTPIQMANVFALIANGGTSYQPHLVREIRDVSGNVIQRFEPQVAHHVDVPESFWQTMKGALVDVIETGTARTAILPGMQWAGKTGSAEHEHGTKTHAWFAGYAPAENPQIAICVLVESAGHGGDVAAPIARDIVQRYFALESSDRKAAAASATLALTDGSP